VCACSLTWALSTRKIFSTTRYTLVVASRIAPGSKHKSHVLVLRAWPARCGICATGTLGSGSGASIAMPCILLDHRGSGMREAEPTSFATEPDQITPEHLEPGKPHCQRLEAV